MRNIIRLIQNNSNLLLFLLIQIISFFFIFNWRNTLHHSKYLSSTNQLFGSIINLNSSITSYFSLAQINQGLQKENEELKSRLFNQEILISNDFVFLNDSVFKNQYGFVYSKVISSQFKNRENILVLNKGSKNGIQNGMGVIGDIGLIGVVSGVGKYYCSVLPIINNKFELAIRHKSTHSFGVVKWLADDDWQTATVEDIPSYMKVSPGDLIETSGATGIFPSGILVGKVIKVDEIEGSQFLNIKIAISENYASLFNSYIIQNKLRDQFKLQKQEE